MSSTSSSHTVSVLRPDLFVLKSAFSLIKTSSKELVAQKDKNEELSPNQLEALRKVINAFCSSIFIKARSQLSMHQADEGADPALLEELARLKSSVRSAHSDLQQLQSDAVTHVQRVFERNTDQLATTITQQEEKEKETDKKEKNKINPLEISRAERVRASLLSTLSNLSSSLPSAVNETTILNEYLSERASGKQSDVESVLEKFRAERERAEKEKQQVEKKNTRGRPRKSTTATSAATTAVKPEASPVKTGTGKVTRTPIRTSARKSVKPY